MNIYVNRQRLRLFRGARVCDAILRYSEQEYRNILSRRKVIRDEQGLTLDLQDVVSDGDCLEIRPINQPVS